MLVAGESTVGDALASTRRSVFRAGFGTGAAVLTSSAPPATAAPATTIADRLSMPVLQQPGVKQPSLFGGQASLYADLFSLRGCKANGRPRAPSLALRHL